MMASPLSAQDKQKLDDGYSLFVANKPHFLNWNFYEQQPELSTLPPIYVLKDPYDQEAIRRATTQEASEKPVEYTIEQIAKFSEAEFKKFLEPFDYTEVRAMYEEMGEKVDEMGYALAEKKITEKEVIAFEDLYYATEDRLDELHKQNMVAADKRIAQQKKEIAGQEKRITEKKADAKALSLIAAALGNLNKE